jgi:arylsulfatase A-like enzyme
MYDTMTRVPMLVWAPGRFDTGGEVDGLCQQMEIGPALLEMAGVEVVPALEAESLLPALAGDEWSGRDEVFAAHGCDVIL